MAKVSVIIPVYRVQPFIAKCVHSLMQQTLDDVEYIFVDDATPDDSINILRSIISEYPSRQSDVKILTHEVNKGLPAARNTGLKEATGEYIFHCDSDDFVNTDMLERMYATAMKNEADIVWCDYYLSFERNERRMIQPSYSTPMEALKGMLYGKMKYNVWNKLVRRDLYITNSIEFPTGYAMGEDLTMMRLFLHANKVVYLPESFYHYVQCNTGSLTAHYTERNLLDLYKNVLWISECLANESEEDLSLEIFCFKLDMKWPFLLNGDRKTFKKWQDWFPEANAFIWRNPQISKRICLVEWMASKNQFWFVWLHYVVVLRFIYGILYK